jgi:hypothetical protein
MGLTSSRYRHTPTPTYDALFSPIDAGAMSLLERHAVAALVAALFVTLS